MTSLAIKLNPANLDNPDLDICYALPDLLVERSGGAIRDNGYDYVGTPAVMVIFLLAEDPASAAMCIIEVLTTIRVLDNDLSRASVLAVEENEEYRVVFPADHSW